MQCDVRKLHMCFFYHLPVAVCNPVLLIPVLSVPAARRYQAQVRRRNTVPSNVKILVCRERSVMLELHCLLIFAQGCGSQWDVTEQDLSKEKVLKCIGTRTNSEMLRAHTRAGLYFMRHSLEISFLCIQ